MIAYAAVVWWTRDTYSTVAKRLEQIQRLACLYITGAIRTTPTAALEQWPPVIDYGYHSGFKMAVGIPLLNALSHVKYLSHFSLVTGQLRSITSIKTMQLISTTWFFQFISDWHNNNVSLNDDIVCFTDGSRLTQVGSSRSGVSIINSQEEYCYPLGYYCTVYQAEIYAVLACAELCSTAPL